MQQLRQGDVFLTLTDAFPGGEPIPPERDDLLVLAHGEATGHLHAISANQTRLYRNAFGFLLVVTEIARLRHGDPDRDWQGDHEDVYHEDIFVPPGTYQVTIDREYQPSGWNEVAD